MKVELIAPGELTAADRELWRSWQQASEEFHSPFLDPAFIDAVAHERSDVCVALIELEGKRAGFFPFELQRGHVGTAAGGPLSDRQAVITPPGQDIDAFALVRGCRLAAYDFHQFVASQSNFQQQNCELADAVYMDLSAGFEAYAAARRAAGSEVLKDTAYKLRRAGRAYGPVRFVAHTVDQQVLEQLVVWKSEQYVRTHAANVFRYPWTKELLRRLLQREGEEIQPRLSALYVGDRLVAAQYALQWRNVLHDWFPAYDPEYARMSPGLALKYELARAASDLGVRRFDLGKNNMPYKTWLATHTFQVAKGSIALTPLTRLWRSSLSGLRRCRRVGWLQGPYETAGRYVRPLRGWLQMR